MKYDIQIQNDPSRGAALVIHFPKADLDRKALYTIQADCPDFLVPFRYRDVDDLTECTYYLENRTSLQYRFSDRTPAECASFWNQILQPLLDCDDWFLKPLSFLLDVRYLYIDRDGKKISYIYIPTIPNCCENSSLKEMAQEIARGNRSTDARLQVQILDGIMYDFQPKAFLKMLGHFSEQPSHEHSVSVDAKRSVMVGLYPEPAATEKGRGTTAESPAQIQRAGQQSAKKEIEDHLSPPELEPREKKKLFSLFGKGKKESKAPKGKAMTGKTPQKREYVYGAGAQENFSQPSGAPVYTPQQDAPMLEDDGLTVVQDPISTGSSHLRLASTAHLPGDIAIDIEPGQQFTIGRFDVSVGKKQSSFEFEKDTPAISRHHAVIKRRQDGAYEIEDLSSKDGTYVNGMRLTPNIPKDLESGCKVSFGTQGADYVWEA